MIIKNYAQHISTEAAISTIIADVRQSNERTMDTKTFDDYMEALKDYRDNAGLECDAVIHLENGDWGAVEIKLGGDELIEAGANSLKCLKNKIVSKSEERAPSFMMVLTAVGDCYMREDGVAVVPINMLKN